MKKGQLKAFIGEHLEPTATSPAAEAKRLLPLLKKARIATTFGSVREGVRLQLQARSLVDRAGTAATTAQRKNGGGNGHATDSLAYQGIPAGAVNGKAERRAELVRGADLLRDLAAAKQTLAGLVTQAQGAVDILARIEADTQARREHLERFAAEWL